MKPLRVRRCKEKEAGGAVSLALQLSRDTIGFIFSEGQFFSLFGVGGGREGGHNLVAPFSTILQRRTSHMATDNSNVDSLQRIL